MQWRKHVRIKYGGRVGVGQGQREPEQVQLQVRVLQLQWEGGARLSYVCHQPQLSSTARRSCSTAAMLCCGRRKVSTLPLQDACSLQLQRDPSPKTRLLYIEGKDPFDTGVGSSSPLMSFNPFGWK